MCIYIWYVCIYIYEYMIYILGWQLARSALESHTREEHSLLKNEAKTKPFVLYISAVRKNNKDVLQYGYNYWKLVMFWMKSVPGRLRYLTIWCQIGVLFGEVMYLLGCRALLEEVCHRRRGLSIYSHIPLLVLCQLLRLDGDVISQLPDAAAVPFPWWCSSPPLEP